MSASYKKISNRRRWSLSGVVLALACLTGLLRPAVAAQIVQVTVNDNADMERLLRAGLDVADISAGGLAEVVLMDEHDRDALISTGLDYFVSLENAEQYFASRLEPHRDDMGGYPTFSEIVAEMNQYHHDYPDIVGQPISIGHTLEGRDIWALKISDHPNDDEDEPEALLMSLIHVREVITSRILNGVMNTLVTGYGHDDRITHLVNDRQIWFIPVVNPDGYVYNEQTNPNGGGMWRKNRRHNDNGSYGVDLNRNFGEHWGFDDYGSSSDPNAEDYRGTGAFSEPETEVLREWVNHRHFGATLGFHSYGNLCMYPYGYDVIQAPDRSLLTALASRMIVVNHYLAGTGWEAIYRTNGECDDWMYGSDEHSRVMAFTIESGTTNDNFWPPLNRVQTLVNENIEACLTIIEYCDHPAKVLQPPQPQGFAVAALDSLPYLTWDPVDDDNNPAAFYRVSARLEGDPVVDDAPADNPRWNLVNFNVSQTDHHSGAYSYRAALAQPMATMTLKDEIVAPDTLRAWVNYTLRPVRSHAVALEASEDGWSWYPLSGDSTQAFIVNQHNIGPALTNTSNGWMQTWWSLGEYAGRVVKLRFRYLSFDIGGNGEFFYVDDISPLPSYQWTHQLADNVQETRWQAGEQMDPDVEFYVQAVDADGDVSFMSQPQRVGEGVNTFTLYSSSGWSIASLQVTPDSLQLESLLAPWVERNILDIVKNGAGDFFAPRQHFNQIGQWNPLEGYLIHLTEPDSLVIIGHPIPVVTPIPLEQGWNMAAYLPRGQMRPEDAWASVQDQVIIAKDIYGNFWIPRMHFDNLPALAPGNGYLMKFAQTDTLIYPAGGGHMRDAAPASSFPAGFTPPGPDNMSLLLELPADISGGEIWLRDSDGIASGAASVKEGGRVGVAAWGEASAGEAGYGHGEPLRIFWRDETGGETELQLTAIEGKPIYETNEVAILGVSAGTLPTTATLLSAAPNPFNSRTTLSFTMSHPGKATLELFDARGRLVESRNMEHYSVGVHRLTLDASQLPAGIYICRMTTLEEESLHRQSIKLLLLR